MTCPEVRRRNIAKRQDIIQQTAADSAGFMLADFDR